MSDHTEADSSPPSHTVHMRRAVDDLRGGMEELRKKVAGGGDVFVCMPNDGNGRSHREQREVIDQLFNSAWLASQRYKKERDDGLQDVHNRLHSCHNCLPIDTVQVHAHHDGLSWNVISPTKERDDNCDREGMQRGNDTCKFKQQYIVRNVPCIIRGLDNSHFADISTQWRWGNDHSDEIVSGGHQDQKQENVNKGNVGELDSRDDTKINTAWFRRFVGSDTLVPVRIGNFDTHDVPNNVEHNGLGLDEEGRAQECETKQMQLNEWIAQCRNQSQLHAGDPTYNVQSGYLKDWHLAQHLSSRRQQCHSTEPLPHLPLYTTPTFFERDLLNNFLHLYSDGGDYKFVYWGPAGSQTRLHSDVLHSFSWSYNVVGKKKWIFHVPNCHKEKGNHAIGEKRCFEIIQHTGETMFVPSTWKHEVTNLVETLSINHNWITSASTDQTWRCVLVEMAAVEEEVKAWGIPDNDFEARENMLRGCIGLDVTMFTLMVVIEIVELLLTLFDDADEEKFIEDGRCRVRDCAYSVFRLENVLDDVTRQPHMAQRLGAVLDSQLLAFEVEEFASDAIKYISLLLKNDQS